MRLRGSGGPGAVAGSGEVGGNGGVHRIGVMPLLQSANKGRKIP